MLAIVSAGIAPGLALLSFFYLKDEYETEPISMVLKTFIFGAMLVLPIMFIQYVFGEEHVFQSPFLLMLLHPSYCYFNVYNFIIEPWLYMPGHNASFVLPSRASHCCGFAPNEMSSLFYL